MQLDWLVTLNLETEPCLSPFGSLQGKRKKAAFGGHKPSGLDTWTPGSLPLEIGSFVWNCPFPFHLGIPRSFPLWPVPNSTFAVARWNDSFNLGQHALLCRMNLQTTTPITVACWLYLRWQGQENTSKNALWQRARSLKFNQNGWVRNRMILWVAWITKWIYDFKSTRWFRENRIYWLFFLPSDASNSRFWFIELASKWIFIHLSAASSLVNERGTRFIGSKDSNKGFNERCWWGFYSN